MCRRRTRQGHCADRDSSGPCTEHIEPACLASIAADDKAALLAFCKDTVGRRASAEYKNPIREVGATWTLQPSHIKELEVMVDAEVVEWPNHKIPKLRTTELAT